MPYTQEGRLIAIDTDLESLGYPAESLLLASFSGHEEMSRLFQFHLDLLQEKGVEGFKGVSFKDIVGKNVTINVTLSDGTQRYFNGLVSRFALSGDDKLFLHYQMEVVPWTWVLTRYSDCKIFHNKAVNAIIQQVFSDRSFTDFKFQLSGTYPTLEYCVQYRETDFNFISRLMEQYGIFYYFEHESGKHTMVIADSSTSLSSCPGQDEFGFNLTGGGLDAEDVVQSISLEQRLLSGKYTLTDYYFETPSANLLSSESTVWGGDNNQDFELYDYPGDYINRTDGTAAAKLRMQEVEAGYTALQGTSCCRAFTTGYTFELTDAPLPSFNTTYLLTEIHHSASAAANYSSSGGGDEKGSDTYSNNFTCTPATLPFRPARLTPKPFVQGPQTAVVVNQNPDSGSSTGEEIWVDKYGRVVVKFPWDRKSACSCWVRVSQDWAGQGWGSITIPRVGQEVIVSFIEGDPDRPIVTGRVYNATQVVPYKLPDYQTRSTFMTRSSKGGSASTYNEIRFEDKAGAEQVFIRAQYDYDTQVLHDTREAIGNNRSLTVAKDQMESVGGDLHTQVAGGVTEKVGKDVNTNVAGGVVESVGKDVNTTVSGGVIESVGKDMNTTVSGGLIESVGKDANTSIGQNLSLKAGQAINVSAGTNLVSASGTAYSHNAGTSIDLKGGTTVTIEAGVTLTLVAGGNSIVIGPSGVSIVGTMVMINSGGSASSANAPTPASPSSPASPTSPGSPTDPDKADDGKTGTKLGSGDFASTPGAASSSSSPAAAGAQGSLLDTSASAGPTVVAGGAAGAAASAASQADQSAQQATQAAAQGAQQAANTAKAAATEAQQAAQQAEQQAQQAAQQVEQQAQQTAQQAQQAAQQAQQAANQAVGQAKAAAQQAAAQAEQQAAQAQAAATQAEQQAQAEAAKVEQQAQATAAQAQQQAQQAEQQAQQAAQQAQQQAQQAVQQGQQAAQQAAQQAKQAAQQAQQQAQQAAQQAQAAATQAQQQAQQAAAQVKQAASGAQQQAQQAAAGAQQAASQAMSQMPKGL